MELPIALVVLALVVTLAWALPEATAFIFIGICLLAAYVVAMAVLARRGRR